MLNYKVVLPFSTLDILCNRGSQTNAGGPGSDIIVSRKSFTVILAF